MSSTPAHADVDDRGTASDTYRCEKNALRDAGRSLAAARDGGAYRATLEDLLEVYKSTLNVKTFANLQQSLAELQQSRLQQLTAHHAPIIAVVADLKQSQIRLSNLTFAATGWEALGENLHQIYRRGRAQFKTVRKKGRDEDFHEWRKRVKDLWYGTRLLKDLWFPVMNAYESEAHGLSKLLGTDRDIAELRQFLHHPTTEIKLKKANTKVLTPLIGHRQYQLQQQALAPGQNSMSKSPPRLAIASVSTDMPGWHKADLLGSAKHRISERWRLHPSRPSCLWRVVVAASLCLVVRVEPTLRQRLTRGKH